VSELDSRPGLYEQLWLVALKPKGAVFAEPLLVAEVEYRAWTQDGKLRHPSFKGIRAFDEKTNDVKGTRSTNRLARSGTSIGRQDANP